MCTMCHGSALDQEAVFSIPVPSVRNDNAPASTRSLVMLLPDASASGVCTVHVAWSQRTTTLPIGMAAACMHVPVPVRSHNLRTSVVEVRKSQLSPLRKRARTMNWKSRKTVNHQRDTTIAAPRLSPDPTFSCARAINCN